MRAIGRGSKGRKELHISDSSGSGIVPPVLMRPAFLQANFIFRVIFGRNPK
jgi:hypothetical protein